MSRSLVSFVLLRDWLSYTVVGVLHVPKANRIKYIFMNHIREIRRPRHPITNVVISLSLLGELAPVNR